MRSRINFAAAEEEAVIDMTPMLDVVFIMLIFFIVSTTFVKDQGVEINSPTSSQAIEKKSQGIIIAIDQDGHAWYEQKQLSLVALNNTLVFELAEKTELSVLIKADLNTPTGALIKLLDEVRSVGVRQVAVATKGLKN